MVCLRRLAGAGSVVEPLAAAFMSAGVFVGDRCFRGIDLAAGAGHLQAIDDDAVVRLQALHDGAEFAKKEAQFDFAAGNRVVRSHDQKETLILFRADRQIRHEQRLVRSAAVDAHAGEDTGRERAVLVRKHAAELNGAGAGVEAVVDEIDEARVRKRSLIFQLDVTRDLRLAHAASVSPARRRSDILEKRAPGRAHSNTSDPRRRRR